jgi:hypothetical protein
VANEACAARVAGSRVWFEGGAIDALVAQGGQVLRTAAPRATRCGLAQVRRLLEGPSLRLLHVVFAPARPRPLLLGLVRLENTGRELLQLQYTELWDVPGGPARREEGACVCAIPDGERALADVGAGVRGRALDPLPETGLALSLRLPLPPGERRELGFAYAAPAAPEPAAPLVLAWRGEVRAELERTTAIWLARLGRAANTLEAYRVEVSQWPA